MGLGKTLQVLSFLVSLLEQQQDSGPHLIIMPLSVVTSWRSDIEKYIPSGLMDVHVHLGTRVEREETFLAWYQRLKTQHYHHNTDDNYFKEKKEKIFMCLTSYNFAMNDIDLFRRLRLTKRNKLFWKYLIVDEAHRLKNSESKLFSCLLQLQCQRHLLLTGKVGLLSFCRLYHSYRHQYRHLFITNTTTSAGTTFAIVASFPGTPLQNNLKELWSLLHFILPNIFADFEEFSGWFNHPFDNLEKSKGAEARGREKQSKDNQQENSYPPNKKVKPGVLHLIHIYRI